MTGTDAGAEAVRFVQAYTPGLNLWYARTALDHLVCHQVQEYLSPGYLGRMKRRVREETGQGFWWEPGRCTVGKPAAQGDGECRPEKVV